MESSTGGSGSVLGFGADLVSVAGVFSGPLADIEFLPGSVLA
jgi:hypothetical protein